MNFRHVGSVIPWKSEFYYDKKANFLCTVIVAGCDIQRHRHTQQGRGDYIQADIEPHLRGDCDHIHIHIE
ncbi:MAG: hypothetical protein BWY95_01300 [Bacteroidetes bacterium ADurb.BinA104]|nr:MAG: hypothetical protein BWY95_01300 [Bacteroidetes bacterium ADurb.BinA104]